MQWFGMPAGSPTTDNAESATSKDCVEPPSAFSKIINCLQNTTDCRQKVIGNDQRLSGITDLDKIFESSTPRHGQALQGRLELFVSFYPWLFRSLIPSGSFL